MRAPIGFVTRFLGALTALALAACASGPVTAPPAGGAPAPTAARTTDPTQPAPVALLLPLSGPEPAQQAQARDMEAAARLALADAPGLVDLRVYDTAADPSRARAMAEQAVAEGAALILGPVYAQEAIEIRPVLAATGTQALSFTPFSGAAGGGVHAMGFAPENDVWRIMSYAAQNGVGRVALVRPDEQYGDVAEAAARDARRTGGAQLVASVPYRRTNEGVQEATRTGAPEILGSGADSVLLVDRGQGLVLVAAFLNYYDVSPGRVRFLGLSGWRTDATLQEAALRGGWFAAPDAGLQQAFAARFRAANGRAPTDLAVLAHDAAAAAAEMVRSARASGARAAFAPDAVERPQGFEGAAGAFRFGRDGLVDRSLAIYEATAEGFALRAPASARFAAGS
ncbi:penicillin-binding protein activator [Rubrimonas sp.]|uniref:penicillin-binding protein activator n=1 Tax=Rubrimonas sp. TaxID=2036015 RepID=UPI002FDE85DB